MANKDGVLSIGIEYKAELNKMIADLEGGLDTISKNNQLSKGMKQQFDNVIAEVRNFKSTMEKELATLGSGKVDKTAFKSFKQTVANNFKTVREDIDRLDLAVSTLNSQMEIISKGVDLSKITKEFASFEDYVNRTNEAVSQLIDTLGQQGISLFSFDNRNISDTKNKIKEIDNIINQLDTDKGAKFELFDEKEAQSELDRLSVQLRSTLELMEHTEKQMSNMDNSTVGFKKMQGDFALLQLKAASLNDTIEMLYTVMEGKGISIEMDDKSLEFYDKYTEDLSDNLESIVASAKNAKKELSTLLESQKQPTVKVSSEMNPNSSELATTVTIETTSSELWKKLSPILTDLQGTLNSNPVVAPVKLVVAPNAVSSTENGDVGKASNAYSKKYAKVLAETGEDAVIDLEGVYKKTFTSIMDAGVSYAKETISKIQDIFDKSPISIKYDISQEEIDKIQNFVLSNKDGKKIDISGQITKAKQEVEELNANIEKTSNLLQETKSKGNVKFDGFDKFTQDISKSIGKLEELQNILKVLQNIEITLSKASGLSSITEIENQWESLEQRIINATKLDGSFRKNASINKIASEYQKYIDMGGTNSISDISKIKENKDTIDAIISKAKEFQKQDFTNDSIDKLSIDLDGVISKFDELISTVKTATNALYKIIRDGNVSDLDKQWSSISNKFKSIADESGKINLSKQKKDVQELMEMYQKYLNAGGMKSPFDLTDNTETLVKLNKVFSQINSRKLDISSISKEKGEFGTVKESVDSLTGSINTKTDAIKTEANTMELAARAEVKSIGKIIESVNQLIERIKNISDIKVPKINISDTIQSDKSNNSSEIKDVFQGDDKAITDASTTAIKEESKALEQVSTSAKEASESKEKFAKANKEVKASADSSKTFISEEEKYFNSLGNAIKSYDSTLTSISRKPADGNRSKELQDKIDIISASLDELRTLESNASKDGYIFNEKDVNRGKELEGIIKNNVELVKQMSSAQKGSDALSRGKEIDTITKYLNKFTGISKQARQELNGLLKQLQSGDPSVNVKKIHERFLELTVAEREAGREARNLFDIFKDKKIYSFLGQAASMFSFYDLIRYGREGIDTIREFDDGLTKISYTMDITKSQLNDLGKSVLDMANDLDSSINNAMQVSQIYANMNTSAEEIKKLSEPTLILSNLTGFDASTVADDIQAVTQQFDIAAESSMHIADVYDQISRNISVDYSKGIESIAEAVQVAGSTADQAGLSFEQLAAIVGETVEKTRLEGSQVGNGLKTIMTRLSKVGELSEEVDNETLSQASESLKKVGIEVYNLDGSYRQFDVIMGELAGKWDSLTDAEKSNISFNIAATRQTNLLSAVLSNFSDSMQLAEEATNANGNALENNQKWVDSFGGHLQSLENTAKSAWINILDSEIIKGGVDILNSLLKVVVGLIDKFGVLGTTAIVGGEILGGKNLGKTYKCTVFKLNCFEYALYS